MRSIIKLYYLGGGRIQGGSNEEVVLNWALKDEHYSAGRRVEESFSAEGPLVAEAQRCEASSTGKRSRCSQYMEVCLLQL